MSSNNNPNGEAGSGLAIVGVLFMFAAMVLFSFIVFFAIILTILSLLALKKPLKLWGKHKIHPVEARIFLKSGVVGAIAYPAMVIFFSLLFNIPIPEDWWFYIVTGGYSFTSIGVMMYLANLHPDGPPPHWLDEPAVMKSPPQVALPTPEPPRFEYAWWDDGAEEPMDSKPECHGCAFKQPIPTATSHAVYRR